VMIFGKVARPSVYFSGQKRSVRSRAKVAKRGRGRFPVGGRGPKGVRARRKRYVALFSGGELRLGGCAGPAGCCARVSRRIVWRIYDCAPVDRDARSIATFVLELDGISGLGNGERRSTPNRGRGLEWCANKKPGALGAGGGIDSDGADKGRALCMHCATLSIYRFCFVRYGGPGIMGWCGGSEEDRRLVRIASADVRDRLEYHRASASRFNLAQRATVSGAQAMGSRQFQRRPCSPSIGRPGEFGRQWDSKGAVNTIGYPQRIAALEDHNRQRRIR